MSLKSFAVSVVAVAALVLVAGCGGVSSSSSSFGLNGNSGNRGDGSIPLGRAKATFNAPMLVTLKFDNGSELSLTPDPSGLVSAPADLPEGKVDISISQSADVQEISFNEVLGPQKTNLFDVNLLPKHFNGNVTSVSLGLPPTIQVSVGNNLKLKPTVSGANAQGLSPSYWVSGGIGKIVPGGVFTATNVGTGTVSVDVLGYEDTVTVVVVP